MGFLNWLITIEKYCRKQFSLQNKSSSFFVIFVILGYLEISTASAVIIYSLLSLVKNQRLLGGDSIFLGLSNLIPKYAFYVYNY